MEPVLFYGVPHGCSFGSIVACEWSGIAYRLCRIDMLASPKDPLYGRANPLQETPALIVEDGEVLTESFAILHHVAARDAGRRLGFAAGTRAADRLNSILAYLHMSLHGAFAPAWAAYKLAEDDPQRGILRAMARDKAARAYARLEALLAGREWLAGDGRTVADAYLAGVARWGEDLGLFEIGRDYPRLGAHLAKLEADPAVVFAHAVEDGRPATTSGRCLGHLSLAELGPRLLAA